MNDLLDELETWGLKKEINSKEFSVLLSLISQIAAFARPDKLQEILKETKDWPIFDDLSILVNSDDLSILVNSDDLSILVNSENKKFIFHHEYTLEHLILLNSLGESLPNIYRRFLSSDKGLDELNSLIEKYCEFSDQLSAVLEFGSAVLLTNEMSLEDLNAFSQKNLKLVVSKIQNWYQDEIAIHTIFTFLLSINWQYSKRRIHKRMKTVYPDSSNSPISPISLSVSDGVTPLIEILGSEELLGSRKDISQGAIYFYNRIESVQLTESMIDFILDLYHYLPEFFYTNDSKVIFDITLRQISRVADNQIELRHSLMKLLPVILDSIPIESPGGEHEKLKNQMTQKLQWIQGSLMTPKATKNLAMKLLLS